MWGDQMVIYAKWGNQLVIHALWGDQVKTYAKWDQRIIYAMWNQVIYTMWHDPEVINIFFKSSCKACYVKKSSSNLC